MVTPETEVGRVMDNSPTRRFVAGASPTQRFADAALRRTPFRRRGGVSPISLFTAWRFTDASPHDISPRTARSSGLKDRRGL